MPEHKETDVRELLNRASANLKTTSAPSPQVPEPVKPQSGVIVKNGRKLWQYVIDDEVIILPKPIEQMSEEDFYRMPVTLMDAGVGRLPADLNVKFKDPQYAGFWFNKKAGDGRRIGVARALKFVPAKIEDLEWYSPHLNDKDGAIEQGGDVVLFKIHKAKLYAYYADSLNRARRAGGIEGYKQQANAVLAPSDQSKDAYYFTPQAMEELQGVAPVMPSGEEGRLTTRS